MAMDAEHGVSDALDGGAPPEQFIEEVELGGTEEPDDHRIEEVEAIDGGGVPEYLFVEMEATALELDQAAEDSPLNEDVTDGGAPAPSLVEAVEEFGVADDEE